MFSIYGFVIFTLVFVTNCDEDFLPPYITPCDLKKDKFVDCVKEQIEKSLANFTKGIPEMDVPSIDPANLDDINIDGSGLNLSFTNPLMHGLSKSKLTKLDVNIGKSQENFSLSFKANLNLTAKYVVDGKILILSIKGNGDALVRADGVEVKIESKLVHVNDSNNQEHFKLVLPKYRYTIEKTTFDLKNLFNGNKQLADTTLKFANQNWEQLMNELAPPAIKQIVRNVVKAINKFFLKVKITTIVKGYDEEFKKELV